MNIRKKGKWSGGETKFVIEDNGKYIETLPKVEDLLKLLRPKNQSCDIKETEKEKSLKEPQKFSQPLLREPQNQDGNAQKIKEETDKIMDKMLVKK